MSKATESYRFEIIDISGYKGPNIQHVNNMIKGEHFTPIMAEYKCYKCGNKKELEKIKSKSWTSQFKCSKCNYYTFIIHADFMGGALHEDVYISKEQYNN